MNRLCTICARGGSQGVPNKNIRSLNGKPLIAHSIQQARESGLFKLVTVSSDSDAILDAASEAGADLTVKRPAELATHEAGKIGAIRHCQITVEEETELTFDTFVDIDATAPLRLPEDIKKAVEILEKNICSSVITGSPARRSPYFNLVEARPDGTVSLSKGRGDYVRRQDVPACYDMNASIYVWNAETFRNKPAVFYDDTRLLVMPEFRSIDIDHEIDFLFVEMVMERNLHLEGTSHEA